MHFGGGRVGGLLAPGGDRLVHARGVDAEAGRQRLEKGDARAGGQLAVAAEDFARQRHAGGLAAAGQQVLGELDQALGAGRRPRRAGRAPASARPRSEMVCSNSPKNEVFMSAPAPGAGGRCYLPGPIRWSGNHVAISGKKHRITIASIMHRT